MPIRADLFESYLSATDKDRDKPVNVLQWWDQEDANLLVELLDGVRDKSVGAMTGELFYNNEDSGMGLQETALFDDDTIEIPQGNKRMTWTMSLNTFSPEAYDRRAIDANAGKAAHYAMMNDGEIKGRRKLTKSLQAKLLTAGYAPNSDRDPKIAGLFEHAREARNSSGVLVRTPEPKFNGIYAVRPDGVVDSKWQGIDRGDPLVCKGNLVATVDTVGIGDDEVDLLDKMATMTNFNPHPITRFKTQSVSDTIVMMGRDDYLSYKGKINRRNSDADVRDLAPKRAMRLAEMRLVKVALLDTLPTKPVIGLRLNRFMWKYLKGDWLNRVGPTKKNRNVSYFSWDHNAQLICTNPAEAVFVMSRYAA